MLYKFGSHSDKDLYHEIDIKNFKNKLDKVLDEDFQIENKELKDAYVKNIIKDEMQFLFFISRFDMSVNDIIKSLVYIYPKLFTSHIIKFIRNRYINNEEFKNKYDMMAL